MNPNTMSPNTLLRVFKCSLPSTNYVFKNGKPAVFQNNRFCTANPAEILELQTEIDAGHPHLYVDPNEEQIEARLVNPVEAMKDRIIQEYLAEQAKQTNAESNLSESIATVVTPASSVDVAPKEIGAASAARLVELMQRNAASAAVAEKPPVV